MGIVAKAKAYFSNKKELAQALTTKVTKTQANVPTAVGILIVIKSFKEMPEEFRFWDMIVLIRKNIKALKANPQLFYEQNKKYLK